MSVVLLRSRTRTIIARPSINYQNQTRKTIRTFRASKGLVYRSQIRTPENKKRMSEPLGSPPCQLPFRRGTTSHSRYASARISCPSFLSVLVITNWLVVSGNNRDIGGGGIWPRLNRPHGVCNSPTSVFALSAAAYPVPMQNPMSRNFPG